MRSIVGWQAEGWFYLSTIPDDFFRFIIAWKLCTTMRNGLDGWNMAYPWRALPFDDPRTNIANLMSQRLS